MSPNHGETKAAIHRCPSGTSKHMHLLEWTGQSNSEINNYSVNEIIWKKDALGMFNIGSEHLDFVLVLTGVCLFVCFVIIYLF